MIFPNQLLETNVSAQAVIYIYMLVNTDVSSAKRALVFFLRDFKSEAKWNKIKLQSWVILTMHAGTHGLHCSITSLWFCCTA